MGDDWLSTTTAAKLWNDVMMTDTPFCGPVSEWSMRKACREGTLAALGIEVRTMPGRYYVSRASLAHYLWAAGQDMSLRADAAAKGED